MSVKGKLHPLGGNLTSPYKSGEIILATDTADASGILEIKFSDYYVLKIVGGGASSCQQKHQNAASGGSGAGFFGEIYLAKGLYKWRVGKQGAKNADQNGEMSYFIKTDDSYGFHCGGGTRNGNSYGIAPPGGTLHVYGNVKVKNVQYQGNGYPGGPAIYGGWQSYQSPSVLAAITGEIYGQGGQGANDNARQGVVVVTAR